MKATDERRLRSFLIDEKKAVKEYVEMSNLMKKAGFMEFAGLFKGMSEDEARHAKNIEYMMKSIASRK